MTALKELNPLSLDADDFRKIAGHAVQTAPLDVQVLPFQVDGFSSQGGRLSLLPSGTWYVGIDLFSGEAIALPRLGHRGWVPVARVITDADAIINLTQIRPVLPKSRLPRTMKKLREGKPISVVVMGSSLTEGISTTVWAGMLFGAGKAEHYRVPGTVALNNIGLGGAPNGYQLAQLGFASATSRGEYSDSAAPLGFGIKSPPNGRSDTLKGVDLVVLGTLANGGDYRLEMIEPILRRLKKAGVEVIVTTDNPQGAVQIGGAGPYRFPGGFSSITNSALYNDGPELIRTANLYGFEIADTAAYVVEATLRYPNDNIYRDSIHMFGAEPAGRAGKPSGGYEVWARAIRSTINIDAIVTPAGQVVKTYDFNDGPNADVRAYRSANTGDAVFENGAVKVTKIISATDQWGLSLFGMPSLKAGDTVRVKGKMKAAGTLVTIGMQGGGAGWGSNGVGTNVPNTGVETAFDITTTLNRDIPSTGYILFFASDSALQGSSFSVDDLEVTYSVSASVSTSFEPIKDREFEALPLPPVRVVADLKTPGDMFITLPRDELRLKANEATKGVLGAHPSGANSFARRFLSSIGAAEDLLTVAAGQRAMMGAMGAVGFAVIHYTRVGDPEVIIEVYRNNGLIKTVTIGAQAASTREIFVPIWTPTELNRATAAPSYDVLDLRVTSGTLRVCALVAQTSDLDIHVPEAATRIGNWAKVGAPQIAGYATDTAGDYAMFRAPPEAKRVYWCLASKPNSKKVDLWSGREASGGVATVGQNHTRVYGVGGDAGDNHVIRLTEVNAATDQAANGYGLHVGGIITVNDR